METLTSVLDFTQGFIFNWTTYYCSIPIFIILFTFLAKWGQGCVMVSDVPPIIFMALVNPIWYTLIVGVISFSPAIAIIIYFYSVKDKKIF